MITPTTLLRAITGRRQKSLKRIFRKLAEILETRVAIGLARDRQQPPFARHPAGQAFVQFQAHAADFRFVMRVRSAKHQIVAVAEIHQAGIALRVFHHQRYNALQNLLQAHLAHHEPADLLKQTELLLNPLQTAFEIFCLRHGFIIV